LPQLDRVRTIIKMSVLGAAIEWSARHLVYLLMFTVGLSLDWAQLRRDVRAGPLLRGIAVALFAVPLLSFVVAGMVPLLPRIRGLLLLMGISPGLPMAIFATRRHAGNVPLSLALSVCLSILAVLTMPLYLSAVSGAFDFDLYARPGSLFAVIASALLAPLAVGALGRALLPRIAKPLARVTTVVFKILFLFVGILVLVLGGSRLRLIDGWVILAMLLIVAGSALLGHLAGAPRPEDRLTVAVAAVFGNPMLALRVAQDGYPELRLAPLVFAYLVVRALAVLPYFHWRKHVRRPTSAATATPR
jgi:BASS family bile acid:Na+ symporter